MKGLFIARDYNDSLYLYFGNEPAKDHESRTWQPDNRPETVFMEIDSSLFPEVQWTDEKPTKVKLTICNNLP